MLGRGLKDGGVDGGAELRVGEKALLDGVVHQRPELLLNGRVTGAGGNENDFVVFGERGDSLALQGLQLGSASLGEDGVGELDPMQVEVKAGDGEGFLVNVSVGFRDRLHVSLRLQVSMATIREQKYLRADRVDPSGRIL